MIVTSPPLSSICGPTKQTRMPYAQTGETGPAVPTMLLNVTSGVPNEATGPTTTGTNQVGCYAGTHH